jgi:hypothetical protein
MPHSVLTSFPPGTSSVTLKAFASQPIAVVRPAVAPATLTPTPDLILLMEVIAAMVLMGAAIMLVSGDLCVPAVDVHPLWIPVLVFAARYGVRGMFMAVAVGALGLAATCMVEHGEMASAMARGSNPYDVVALVACTLVAWTSMIRDGRLARTAQDGGELVQRLENSEETARALREVVGVLRDRLDRIDLSISMWRAIAGRLDHGTLNDAAAAALELAAIRTGAATGVVLLNTGFRLETIATYGHASGSGDFSSDRTVCWAFSHERPALRGHVRDATLEDMEVAVPIIGNDGSVIGVLAMRDTPPARLRAAEVRDVQVVGTWLAPAFVRSIARNGDAQS